MYSQYVILGKMSPKSQVNKGDLCKVTIFLLFGLLISPSFSYATTIIPDLNSGGYFTGDVTWTKAESPYVVTSAIFTNTSSLTIEPGAIVKFNPGYGIQVRGKLVVGSATTTEKVYFTSIKDDTIGGDTNNDATSTLPQAGNWGGLNFAGPVGVVGSINNTIFRYGGSGSLFSATLFIFGGSINISHSQITDTSNFAIYQSAGSTNVVSSEIKSKCGGIRLAGGTLDITLSSILKDVNTTGWCYFFPYGIDNRTSTPLPALNNWWGTPLGPQHFTNPNGTGNSISGNVNFTPWLTSDPFDTTTCSQNCYSNILFLPGLEASRLYRTDTSATTDQLWEPNTNSDVEELFLSAEGKSLRSDVYTKDVIDEAYSNGPNIYKSFLDEMKTWEGTYGITATTTPYDWRLSLEDIVSNGTIAGEGISYLTATSSPYLIQQLRRIAKTSKTGKVTIVAHSNGGLVAKALMQRLGDAETIKLIDKVIFVAVPQEGTPQAIGALLHGYEQGLPKDWLHFFLSPQVARTLAENMPSAYNLLPSAKYFTTVSNPVATFEDKPILAEFRARYGNEIHDEMQLKNFITDTQRYASSTPSDLIYPSVGNTLLYSNAEVAHNNLDNWTPPQGISLYEIAGWGEDTLATIEYKDGKKTICKETQPSFPFTKTYCTYVTTPTIIYSPKEVVDGDGTVVTSSALVNTASTTMKYWVNLRDYDTISNYEREHADILEVYSLRTLIQSILTNSAITTLPEFISTSIPPTDSVERLSFILHSPLNLSATDNLGSVVSSTTSTIPGGSFKRYGEVQVLKVPKGTPITINLDGYATGSFTLDMQEIDGLNSIIASTTFSGIPSATSTTATIAFPDGTLQNSTPLLVDYDNNGTTDFILRPSIGEEIVFDVTPPESRVSFNQNTNQLLIEGLDEAGRTIVHTTATSTIITDESSNTVGFIFSKFNQENHELKLEIQSLAYNGVSTSTIPETTLQYEWSTDKIGNIRELEQKVTVGSLKINGHYDAKKNVTTIKKKLNEVDNNEHYEKEEAQETLPGFISIGIKTEKGIITISY